MDYYDISDIEFFPSTKRFQPSETEKVLRFVFNDLSIKSKNQSLKEISRLSFLEYFSIPLLISERIYETLFKSKENIISFLFISEFQNLLALSPNAMVKLVFDIYDFNRDGIITYKDIKIVHNNIVSFARYNSKGKLSLPIIKSIECLEFNDIQSQLTYDDFVEHIQKKNCDIFTLVFYYLTRIYEEIIEMIDFTTENPQREEKREEFPLAKGTVKWFKEESKSPRNSEEVKKEIQNDDYLSFRASKIKGKNPSIQFKPKMFLKVPQKSKLNNKTNKTIDYNDNSASLIIKKVSKAQAPIRAPSIEISIDREKEKKGSFFSLQKNFNSTLNRISFSKPKNSKYILLKKNPVKTLESISISKPHKTRNTFSTINTSSLSTSMQSPQPKKKEVFPHSFILTFSSPTKFFFKFTSNSKKIFYYDSETSEQKGVINLYHTTFRPNGKSAGKGTSRKALSISLYHNVNNIQIFFDNELDYNYFLQNIYHTNVANNSDVASKYQILNLVGQGKYSLIYRCKSKNEIVAMKILRKLKLNKVDYEAMRREIMIMQQVRHKNIISFKEYGETFEYVYIIMEYNDNLDIKKYFQAGNVISLQSVKKVMCDLLDILSYLHSNGIIHRDIKGDNLLYDPVHHSIKLIDFGLSRVLGDGQMISKEPFGTLGYAAPEILLGKDYDFSVDIFSFGCFSFSLLFRELPFDDENDKKIYRNSIKCVVDYGEYVYIKKFMKNIITKNTKRDNINEIKENMYLIKG